MKEIQGFFAASPVVRSKDFASINQNAFTCPNSVRQSMLDFVQGERFATLHLCGRDGLSYIDSLHS